ncbi:MAG: nucleotidyltransferase domain-containing protein [Nanoarchaeota archaeon]|nr:nucleotidyltransferase domain-containing protein [Nanoarchaeota archaeon]
MDFAIPKVKKKNLEKYHPTHKDIAFEFAKRIKKEVGDYIKMIVLFGSTTRKQTTKERTGDIDIMIILDDTIFTLDQDFTQTYRIIVEKTINTISRKLHITTFRLTTWWEYIRAGDPVAINILRDGVALVDPGIFDPLQMLLYQGRIRPTPESAYAYYQRAPNTLRNSKWHVMQATIDLYWAVIDAAHAALIKLNCVPPSPEFVPQLLEDKMVKKGLLDKKYVKVVDRFYHIAKGVMHNQITHVDGDNYDQYYKEAEEFVKVMQDFLKK